jgi:hypothetical protein
MRSIVDTCGVDENIRCARIRFYRVNRISHRNLVRKIRDDSFSRDMQVGEMINSILQRFRSPRNQNNATSCATKCNSHFTSYSGTATRHNGDFAREAEEAG